MKKGRALSERDFDVVSGGRIGHKKSDWLEQDIYTVYDNETHEMVNRFQGKGAFEKAKVLDASHNRGKKWKTLNDLEGFDYGGVQAAYNQRKWK